MAVSTPRESRKARLEALDTDISSSTLILFRHNCLALVYEKRSSTRSRGPRER